MAVANHRDSAILRLVLLEAALSLPLIFAAQHLVAAEPQPAAIFDAQSIRFHPGQFTGKNKQKIEVGTVNAVDDAKFGKAMRLSFVEGASGGFFAARIPSAKDWDRAAGFSFWVKGDGSRHFGGIELIDRRDFALRYAYCFPIESREWRKIVVAWSDLTPEVAAPLVGVPGGYNPSGFGSFSFGKWFYWRDYPAESFEVGPIALEAKIDSPAAAPLEPGQGLKRVAEKIRQHKPITIVTMSDSLTDPHHWSNRPILWVDLLVKQLKERDHCAATLVNPSIGGTTLSQNMVLMPRWLAEAPTPDLVAIWFGGNDWDSNVRGERFAEYLRTAIDRIRRQTHGSADILLMTTLPGRTRWRLTAEIEQAIRDVAAEKKTGLVDAAAEFRKAGSPEAAFNQQYWGWDGRHLGAKGHEIIAAAVLKALESN